MLLQYLRATGEKLTSLKRVVIGGSAVPEAITRAFHDDYGVDVVHAWGMTETSPLATLSTPTPEIARLSFDAQMAYELKQGRPAAGVQLRLVGRDRSSFVRKSDALKIAPGGCAPMDLKRPSCNRSIVSVTMGAESA
jgi:acyl-CoA synthetase (AMP-forming)/AMP-acid ligase II